MTPRIARWVLAPALLAVGLAGLSACADGDGGPPAPRAGAAAGDDVEVLVAFGLERDDRALANFVERTATPGEDDLGRFLTPGQLRERFGADPETIDDAQGRLADAGIDDAELDASGAVLQAQVTAAQARELGIDLVVQDREDGSRVVVPATDPGVPDALAGPITEVVGLTATIEPAAGAAVGPLPATEPAPGCDDPDLADDLAVADANRWAGTEPLYEAGHDGDGVTIALLAIERFDPAPVQAFAACRESPTVIPEVVSLPLTPPAPTGDEVTLDVIMAGWTAPGARLLVVQSDPYASPVFPLLQVLTSSEAGPEPVDVLSTSISYCEDALPEPELALADHALLALAATGVTTLAAAGDHGSAGCWPGSEDELAAYPASSPWATAVGGTALVLDDAGAIVGEQAWTDPATGASGGGGTSGRSDQPAYQRRAGVGGDRRRYPDVSALAAVDRINSIPRCDGVQCTWDQIGGTSAPAPALAGDLAVALSASAAAGGAEQAGWLNPSIATWAANVGDPIFDVVDGTTAADGRSCCAAGPGYDEATGFGSIVGWDRIAQQLADRPGTTG